MRDFAGKVAVVTGAPPSVVEQARSDRVRALAEAEGMEPEELAGIVV